MRLTHIVVFLFSLLLFSCGNPPSQPATDSRPKATQDNEPKTMANKQQQSPNEQAKAPPVVKPKESKQVKISPSELSPIVINSPDSVNESQSVTLTASVKGVDRRKVWRRWYQLSGPAPRVYIDDPRAFGITFIAPQVNEPTQLSFVFEVHESTIGTTSKQVDITINNVAELPEVFAGEDIEIEEKQPLTLYGFGQDVNGKAVRFHWMIEPPGLFNLVLEDIDQPDARLIAPQVAQKQAVALRLTVTDDHGRSASDHIQVTIVPEQMPDLSILDVVIEDKNLAACITEHSEKYGRYFAKEVRRLQCSNRQITKLTGLEYFYNLLWLDLSDNRLQNIDVLMQLPALMFLKLDRNRIKDISPLKYSRKLTSIGLSNNQIESIAALTYMPWLRQLTLSYNNIKDNSPLLNLAPQKEQIRLYYDDLDCQTVLTLHRSTEIKVMLKEACETVAP